MKRASDLTVKETIKALRICSTLGASCNECPLIPLPSDSPHVCDNLGLPLHAADLLELFHDDQTEEAAP